MFTFYNSQYSNNQTNIYVLLLIYIQYTIKRENYNRKKCLIAYEFS